MSIWSTPLTQQSLMLSHMVLSCCSSCLERPLKPECRESIKFSLICLRWYHIMLGALLLPISAKMSRQKEKVISFKIRDVSLEDRSDVDVFSKLLGVFTEHCSGANMYFTIGLHPVSQARPSLPSLIDWDLKVVFAPVGVWFSHRVVLEIGECYFWFCEKVKSKIDLSWTFLWFSSRSISCAASTWSLLVKIQILHSC